VAADSLAALGPAFAKAGIVRVTVDGEPALLEREPVIPFDGIGVTPPPGAFLQATGHGEESLRAAVTEALGPAERIADLFCGAGTFALPLARRASVLAVDGDAALVAALEKAARHTAGLRPIRTATRNLFKAPLGPEELAGLDAVVIDPPRAGAEAQTRALARSGLPRIAMVSCNPASFARDARILTEAGYRLNWVQIVDQFRWSPHVELAASLTAHHIAA